MKFIAITPDDFNCDDLVNSFCLLKEIGASHIYVRSPLILNSPELKNICEKLKDKGMIPLIPFDKWKDLKDNHIICHFKEKSIVFFNDFLKKNFNFRFSVSCHSIELAEKMLEKGATFVFISPIFKPYSKKDYHLKPLGLDEISPLLDKFGDKVVLLGGIDFERVKGLKLKLQKDFSIAGITMFFGRRD
ncbi:thiamine-phosphate pyrophosphorylase [Thermotomaculum hydrothermale]|uniref:Thiamine-phosphate pyrophosphorylase n=1 Tax=Thermotomaculum hydrothermale TaxID=981385 RepID=A0A7R6SYQ4_9BACT|nr:thiamine phosphate synthase [Thermotomaculum hydrothermale]BBB32821.1 thiamine-phosphate pyrophosphorylase [Thermotomaculum hydrothermale]